MIQIAENEMKDTDPCVESFEQIEKQRHHPAWLFPLRKAGIARFAELGFPTLRDEDWRFTDLAPTGVVHVKAEEWSASITEGALPRGARVRVVGKDGLRLVVEPAEEPERADRAPKEGSTT